MMVRDSERRVAREARPLTLRQREVVRLLTAGLDVEEVATQLRCSQRTIRKHIQDIGEKIPGPRTPMYRILTYGPALIAEAG